MLPGNTIIPLDDVKKEILEFCLEPHGKVDILEHIRVETTPENYTRYIGQLLNQRFITSDLLISRNSTRQKFITTQKGLNYLKAIA